MLGETISAIATAPGTGGIGVIRISGPNALKILQAVFTPHSAVGFIPRYMTLGRVKNAAGDVLDEALAVYMPAPHSYTGENVAEIQCHGGYVVCQEILSATFGAGAVPAHAGEFTSRAFINGKLSLDQAEAVIDIIEAKTAEGLKAAERQLAGGLKQKISAAADILLDMLAELELMIDYPEEHESAAPGAGLAGRLDEVAAQVDKLLARADEGRILRDGAITAIIGPANAGKSTLLNALLQYERSIVTQIAGTTRDTVEEFYNLGGWPLKLVDTAGIRDTDDVVEQVGIERSRRALADADLVLLLLDGTCPVDAFWLQLIAQNAARPLLVLLNKADLCTAADIAKRRAQIAAVANVPVISISAKQGAGVNELKTQIVGLLAGAAPGEPLTCLLNNRQKAALLQARAALADAAAHIAFFDADMLSVDIQTAWQALAEISGEAAADDIIDRVFSRFCLGK